MGNLRDANKLRPMKPTDVVLGADEQGCLVNFPPENFSGSIPVNIDTETGDGQELFTEPQVNDYLFKKIKSKDGSTDVITDTDGNIDLSVNFPPFPPFPEIPTVDYPVIDGISVGTPGVGKYPFYLGLENKKIKIPMLSSPKGSILINTLEDGSVGIDVPDPNPTVRSFYVNADAPENGDGSAGRPYKRYEDAKTAVIGSGNYIQPEWHGAKIIIQTSVNSSEDLNINGVVNEIQNDSIFRYTGNKLLIDSESFYTDLLNETFVSQFPHLKLGVNGEYPIDVVCYVTGNGVFTSNKGGTLCRWYGPVRNSSNTSFTKSLLVLNLLGSQEIQFYEGVTDQSVFTEDVYYANGTRMQDAYGYPFKATTTLLPTSYLIDSKYKNNGSQATIQYRGIIKLTTVGSSSIYIGNKSQVIAIDSNGKIQSGFVQTRVCYDGTFAPDYGDYKVYKPYSNRTVFHIDDGTFSGTFEMKEASGFAHTGWGSLIRLKDNASFFNFNMQIEGPFYANEIFLMTGNTNVATTTSGNIVKILGYGVQNLVRSRTANTISVYMPNSIIKVRGSVFKDVTNYYLGTDGTISSLNGNPVISGLPTNDTGLLTGTLWHDTTNNVIKRKL